MKVAVTDGEPEFVAKVHDWINKSRGTVVTARRSADVLIAVTGGPVPSAARKKDRLIIGVVSARHSSWADGLNDCAVDGIIACGPGERELMPAVPLDPVTLQDDFDEVVRLCRSKPRVAIGTSVRFRHRANLWGDTYFARDVGHGLRRRGWRTEVVTHSELRRTKNQANDVLLYLRGLRSAPRVATPVATWIISHPTDVRTSEANCRLVYAASSMAADRFGARPLLQATNPHRFWPEPKIESLRGETIFVGNTRNRDRECVDLALAAGYRVHVIGNGWNSTDQLHVIAQAVDNDVLRQYYSSAAVVLNDHWPDMREYGILSNRLFDAVSCGATVVSDFVEGLSAVFGDEVASFAEPRGFESVFRASHDEHGDESVVARRHRLIRSKHSFDQRCGQLDSELRGILS